MGTGKSLYQMGEGLVTSIAHPSQFVEGLSYAASHPGDALKSIFLGDAEKDWNNGNYGEAIGDVFANTGSLLIPGVDIATGVGDAGKVGKLGELGKLGKAGDVGKLGKVGALGAVRVPALLHLGGRFAAPAEDGCTPEEQENVDDAEKSKNKAKADAWDVHLKDPDSLKGMPSDDVKNLIPDDWTATPQKKGAGTKYVDPNHKGRQVLVEEGSTPKSGQTPNVHHGPYIKVSQNGKVERIPLKGNPTL